MNILDKEDKERRYTSSGFHGHIATADCMIIKRNPYIWFQHVHPRAASKVDENAARLYHEQALTSCTFAGAYSSLRSHELMLIVVPISASILSFSLPMAPCIGDEPHVVGII